MNHLDKHLTLAHREWLQASRAYWEAVRSGSAAELSNRGLLSRKLDQKLSVLSDARRRAREEFAADRGWKYRALGFSVSDLVHGKVSRPIRAAYDHPVVDHPECFTLAGRPIAIVTHSYATWAEILEYAEERNLRVEELPFSSYSPGGCKAALLTRAEAAS